VQSLAGAAAAVNGTEDVGEGRRPSCSPLGLGGPRGGMVGAGGAAQVGAPLHENPS
jgi:hypothetical protein